MDIYYPNTIRHLRFFWWRKKMVKENLAKMHILKIGPDEIAFQHTEDYDLSKLNLTGLNSITLKVVLK